VNRFVTNIVIATNYQIRKFISQVFDIILKITAKLHFEIQTIYIGSARDIDADDGNAFIIYSQNASFVVDVFDSGSEFYFFRLMFSENRNAAVAFFLGRMPIREIADFAE